MHLAVATAHAVSNSSKWGQTGTFVLPLDCCIQWTVNKTIINVHYRLVWQTDLRLLGKLSDDFRYLNHLCFSRVIKFLKQIIIFYKLYIISSIVLVSCYYKHLKKKRVLYFWFQSLCYIWWRVTQWYQKLADALAI